MFYGWRIVVVAMLAMGLSNGMNSYSYGLLVLPVGTEFGASRMAMMWGLTAGSLTTVLISPFAGSLMDRRSARTLFAVGAAALALAMVVIALSRNVWQFVLAYGLPMAVGATLLGQIGTNTLVSRWFTQHRGRALGITALGTSLGGLLMPLIVQSLVDTYGWRSACLWLAAIALVVLLPPIWLIVRNRPSDIGLHPDGGSADDHARAAAAGAGSTQLPDLLTSIAFWRIALAVGALMATFTVILANLVPYAIGHGVAAKQAAFLISTVSVAGISGKLIFSIFADRIDLKWALLGALALIAVSLALLVRFHEQWIMLTAAAMIGLASGAFLPAWGALLARLYGPFIFGRVMGRMQPIAIIMVMLAMPLSGHLFDRTGSYAATFLMMAGVAAVAFFILLPLRMEAPGIAVTEGR
ncbi:MAG: MFS transporter [Steroidobacteraceae bacterium]